MTSARPRFALSLFVAATAATIAGVGCASTAGPGVPASQPASPTAAGGNAPARSTASILIAEDLRKSDAQNLGDAIQRLRPEWLRRSSARAANSMGTRGNAAEPLVVWIDNNRAGGVELLAQMQISNVRMVQYFTPSEAESRFGTGNSSGAIQVITLAGARP
jgi:hypothetical protein